jgi:hypothetical protein
VAVSIVLLTSVFLVIDRPSTPTETTSASRLTSSTFASTSTVTTSDYTTSTTSNLDSGVSVSIMINQIIYTTSISSTTNSTCSPGLQFIVTLQFIQNGTGGAGLGGVMVSLYKDSYQFMSGSTDGNGLVIFRGVYPGNYDFIYSNPPEYLPLKGLGTFSVNCQDYSTSRTLSVSLIQGGLGY